MREGTGTPAHPDDDPAAVDPGDRQPPRNVWSRLVAPTVAVGIAALATLLALLSNGVTERQEKELLTDRASELAALLGVSTSEARSVLLVAGTSTTLPGGSGLFDTVTAGTTATGADVVVAERRGTGYVAVARAGDGAPALGARIDPLIDGVAERARASKGVVSKVIQFPTGTRLILAMAVAGDPRRVALLDNPLSPDQPAPQDPDSPYRELNVAVYAADNPDPAQLVLTSAKDPGTGEGVAEKKFAVGADTWLVVASAREPLVGSMATAFPWLLFAAGIATALIVGLLIETLVRRRAYALRLVEERTRSLREAQAAAEKANKAKSEFLSRMSHELRTPLNAVLGFAQLLEMDGLTPEQAENVTQITKGGGHLLDLINEILDISQIESGRMSLSPEAVLVTEVVDAATRLVRPLAEERSVHLIASASTDGDRYVFADRQRLQQILLNLLSNGIKYNRPGGSVSVSCYEHSPGELRIQVTDTGPGIAADKLHLLFAPFERLGAEQTTIEGTGVGLALSRGLAEAMGGTLDVDTSPNRGSTFWVEFPIVDSPVDAFERTSSGPVPRTDGTKLILHIEDNPANLDLVERVLAQRPELTVIPAMQGRMGLDLARRQHPVLILLDLNLADLPGTEVLSALREDPDTADIPVVVISADAMPRQVQRLLSSGAIAYLTKPIDIRQLLTLVDEAVADASGTAGTGAGAALEPGSRG